MTKTTTFSTVPLQEVPGPESETQEVPGQESETQDAHRPSVIVVDDESNIADTLAEILSRSGYAAVAAYDADSALETALLKPPELLITDVMLPGTNGIDLAIQIRRIFPDCGIFLFSGQAGTTDLLAAASRAGHEFVLLTKPVHPVELLARISENRQTSQTRNLRRELAADR
jgi:DNA-binding response OmpR family regulator